MSYRMVEIKHLKGKKSFSYEQQLSKRDRNQVNRLALISRSGMYLEVEGNEIIDLVEAKSLASRFNDRRKANRFRVRAEKTFGESFKIVTVPRFRLN